MEGFPLAAVKGTTATAVVTGVCLFIMFVFAVRMFHKTFFSDSPRKLC